MADAQLPQLQVVDARLLGMAQEALWRQLRLPEVNAELAAGLSEVEVQACSEEGYPTGGDPPGRRGRGRARGGGGRLRRGAAGEPPRPGERRQPWQIF